MLSFQDITIENWNKVAGSILRSEKSFKKAIRTEKEDYAEILMDGDALIKVAFIGEKYVGNAIGYPPTEIELEEDELDGYKNTRFLYLFNIVIDKKYQGRGYGNQLLKEFLVTAKEKGYHKVIGHFRPNGSLALLKKFGGKEIRICPNWENTHEDYSFCELDLSKLQISESVLTVRN